MRTVILFAVALSLISTSTASAAEVTATRLDGATLTGELQRWTNEQVIIKTDSGPQTILSDQLLSLRLFPMPTPPATQDAKPPAVELVDGSLLPIDDFRVADGKATIALAGENIPADAKQLSTSVRQVASVRLKPISAALLPQWNEIRDQNLPSDVLVVFKREGQSLDYAEGVIGEVSADRISFELDNRPTRVDRGQAAGIFFYRRGAKPTNEPLCTVHGRGGLKAAVAQLTLAGDTLRLRTLSGIELNWPLADVHLADFSAGKLVYLSDLDPATQTWTPLVGLPPSAKSAAAYGRPRRDASAFGGSLALWFPEEAGSDEPGRERTFSKGLAVHSRTELAYRLPAGFRRLVATAGIDPVTSAVGNVTLTVKGDDRVLFEKEIAGNQPPVPLDLKIEGVRRLSIVVDYGRNLDNGDWLNLCDVRIVK